MALNALGDETVVTTGENDVWSILPRKFEPTREVDRFGWPLGCDDLFFEKGEENLETLVARFISESESVNFGKNPVQGLGDCEELVFICDWDMLVNFTEEGWESLRERLSIDVLEVMFNPSVSYTHLTLPTTPYV